jgi:magnesium transporter
LTISSYIINAITIRPVNVISESSSIREEMKKKVEEYLWVHANEIEDIFLLQDMFGLHPLTVEAILHQNQPSKIEDYDRYIFAVIDGIVEEDSSKNKAIGEGNNKDKKLSSEMIIEDDLYVFLEKRWIITLNFHNHNLEKNIKKNIKTIMQQAKSSSLSTATFSNSKKESFDINKSGIIKKNELIFRLALQEMILSYYPILDNMSKDLEQTEEDILDENISSSSNKNTKFQLSKILLLRKKITFIERTLGMISRAIQDFVNRNNIINNSSNDNEIFSNNHIPDTLTTTSNNISKTLLSPDSIRHMHSLNDRIRYLRNDVENMHQRIISLRETYNSSLSANLNETIRTLTVIATIVLPLTLITGIYGMNFEFMPELTYEFGYFYALGLIAAVGGGMIIYFKRKKWI